MSVQNEKETLNTLTALCKDKHNWSIEIDHVATFLDSSSEKVKAKALWLLGEMGLQYSQQIQPYVPVITKLLSDTNDKIRERAVGALGRIGRNNYEAVAPYIEKMMEKANDKASLVRMNFIWAAENIATNHPQVFADKMDVFAALLADKAIRVRIEAPEIFRVIGKRKPDMVLPYIEKLKQMAEHDEDRVVRIHSAGAVRATIGNANEA